MANQHLTIHRAGILEHREAGTATYPAVISTEVVRLDELIHWLHVRGQTELVDEIERSRDGSE